MWIPILFTLFAFGSVHANIEKELQKCGDMIDLEDENLPEDLDEVCPAILGLFDCIETAIDKGLGLSLEQIGSLLPANSRESELFSVGLNVRSLIKELCDHDSELRKEYDADAECFKTVNAHGDNEDCEKEADQAINMYEEMYNTVEQEPNEDNRKCMTTAFVVACTAAQVKAKCGDRAFNTFRKIIKRTTMFKYGICTEEQVESLKTFALDHLDVSGENRDVIQLAFDIKKRRK